LRHGYQGVSNVIKHVQCINRYYIVHPMLFSNGSQVIDKLKGK